MKSSYKMKIFRIFTIIAFLLITSCSSFVYTYASVEPTVTPVQIQPSSTPFQPEQVINLFLSPGVPEAWVTLVTGQEGISLVNDLSMADISILVNSPNNGFNTISTSIMVFAVAVPFFTVQDGIELSEITRLWQGDGAGGSDHALIVSPATKAVLDEIWGPSASRVQLAQDDAILPALENSTGLMAIIPFEAITPRTKILKISGLSPLDKPLDEDRYPLAVPFSVVMREGASQEVAEAAQKITRLLPATNRDESKMTVIIMSGTTALTRAIAAKIEVKGKDYPIELVKDWFLAADLRHVSNEIPFVEGCPKPDAYSKSLQFCSNPENITILDNLGVNVVELTGNHENDYGSRNFASTIKMYQDRNWMIYGGGLNPDTASLPATVEVNGNKIAFVGCNRVGPTQVWVGEGYPGAAKCDFVSLYKQISELKKQGYVVITTYQHQEIYKYMYEYSSEKSYRRDFQRAIEAGADIVQGSQAHYPMGFELIGNGFIHYGLGNFLFDQMDIPVKGTRREFIDRHIVYDGRYINTEILTALLEDYSRPTPMSEGDRAQFLTDVFEASER